MRPRIRGSITSLRQSALLTALTLLGSVWAMAQVAAVPVKAPEASSPAYPLELSANRRYLVDQNNIPFLITGDNPHALLGMGPFPNTGTRQFTPPGNNHDGDTDRVLLLLALSSGE